MIYFNKKTTEIKQRGGENNAITLKKIHKKEKETKINPKLFRPKVLS